jgi:hypothetical protein
MAKQKPMKWYEKVNQKLDLWVENLKNKTLVPLESWLKSLADRSKTYLKKNGTVILILAIIIIAAYGFDLFNLNLTIDEEVHSFYNPPETWIRQGRWAIYVMRKMMLPYTTVPFIPLFLGLCFHLAGMLILVEAWGLKRAWHKVLVGAIGILCPVVATMYTFSIMNFAVGAGYFSVALSLLIFARAKKGWKYLAILPGMFGIGVYQAFLPTLLVAYLAYLVVQGLRENAALYKNTLKMLAIVVGSLAGYWCVQQLLQLSNDAFISNYVTNQLSLPTSWQDFLFLGRGFLVEIFRLYSGHESLYIEKLYSLGILIFLAAAAYLVEQADVRMKVGQKIWSILLYALLIVAPFISGFFMHGAYIPRFLLSYPLALAGLVAVGLHSRHVIMRALILVFAAMTVFGFALTDNRLFAASYFALQADRLTAANLDLRISDAISEAGMTRDDINYLEVVGYLDYPESPLIPEIDTFGGSFFQWDSGNNIRIILFLRTLGIGAYDTLPNEQRLEMVPIAQAMPNWPDPHSVKVEGDAVLVKFGDYSAFQVNNICGSLFESGGSEYQACTARFDGQ